jgi:hypothetical protein
LIFNFNRTKSSTNYKTKKSVFSQEAHNDEHPVMSNSHFFWSFLLVTWFRPLIPGSRPGCGGAFEFQQTDLHP